MKGVVDIKTRRKEKESGFVPFVHGEAQQEDVGSRFQLTCLASTSRVMKKMKREMEPMVFRSFRTPGLKGQRAMGKGSRRGGGRGQEQIKGDVTGVEREKDSDATQGTFN